jgi:hypothetical protein
MNRLLGKLTYSNVVSTLCLFLLVGGGTAFAASKMADNGVQVRTVSKWISSGDGDVLEAECKPGEVAVGGSASEGPGTPLGTIRSFSPSGRPTTRGASDTLVGWQSFGWNPVGGSSGLYEVSVLCASR